MKSNELRRDLGLFDAVAIGWGAIVGAGLFVVTGVAAAVAGPAFLVGLLVAAVVATFNALSSAQLAANYPRSGGTYEYGYEVLHPWAGFAAGWTFLASKLAAGGTVAIGFGGYLAALVPGVSAQAAAASAVVALTVANYLGIRKAGRLNIAIVVVTLTSLAYFAVTGLPAFQRENLEPFAPEGAGSVLRSAALLFFAYTGYARIATLAEEVREPRRTIPRAIMISLGTAAVLYLLVAFVAVGAVGAETMASSRSPLATAAERIGAPAGALAIGIGAAAAMLGVLLSQVLGISRVMLAMARRGDLPPGLGHVSEKRAVPDKAIFVTGAIILLLALFGTLEWIVASATFTILLYYTITNVAALRLEKKLKLYGDAIAVLGTLSCLALAFSLKPETIAWGLLLLAAGFAFRALLRRPVRGRS
ncbi:MAG TPA: APC family permease [Fimbriimonas sp.]